MIRNRFFQPLKSFVVVDKTPAHVEQVWRKAVLCGTPKTIRWVVIRNIAAYHVAHRIAKGLWSRQLTRVVCGYGCHNLVNSTPYSGKTPK